MSVAAVRRTRWINYAAALWALLFAVPHVWWAFGISAGFPGGKSSHRLMMSSQWRYTFDIVVVILCAAAIFVALALVRPRGLIARIVAWIACTMLTLRGIAGLVVDGAADLVWWPTFMAGGLFFAAVACLARAPTDPEPSPSI